MTGSGHTPALSKSKLLSAQQCLKRLYLGWHHPDLAAASDQREAAFRTGHEVGDVAKQIYGSANAVEIEYRPGGMSAMVEETAALIDGGADFPIFEATFRHQGVLVRVDVLIPVDDGWRAVEIKASTRVKPENKIDCAIQWWVMRGAGVPVRSIALGHVNNQFIYGGDENYAGLITEEDLTEEVAPLSDFVVQLIAESRNAITGELPDIAIGAHCNKPYECEFRQHCWPLDTEYPVPGIGGSKAKHAEWINRGITDLRDIPAEEITNEKQQRIHRVTQSGEAEVLKGAKAILEALEYPRFYLDFETIGPAVPIWKGMRPYQAVPIQWSIHIDEGTGDGSTESLRHEEFLDLSGNPPMRPLAEKMIDCLGDSGPVFMYTSYERGVIKTLIELFPDLDEPLQKIIGRLFDLQPVVTEHFYHPSMLGSWSIKTVAPAMAAHMDYKNLKGIQEGTAASEAYLTAIHPLTTSDDKSEIEEQLLRYCRFDTEAMVEIAHFLCSDHA